MDTLTHGKQGGVPNHFFEGSKICVTTRMKWNERAFYDRESIMFCSPMTDSENSIERASFGTGREGGVTTREQRQSMKQNAVRLIHTQRKSTQLSLLT